MESCKGDITQLLEAARRGDPAANQRLFAQIYGELGRLARFHLARESTLSQLDAAGLVNEAYLRLHGLSALPGGNRHAFLAYAASVMRSVIVDYARRRSSRKRGGDWKRVTLTGSGLEEELAGGLAASRDIDIERLDSGLQALRKVDERCHQIVEMRYFAGMSIEQVAEALELSPATVKRDWRSARAFLLHELGDSPV